VKGEKEEALAETQTLLKRYEIAESKAENTEDAATLTAELRKAV
jgi:hypothetical protein